MKKSKLTKTLIAMFVCAAMAFSLTACTDPTTPTTPTNNQSSNPNPSENGPPTESDDLKVHDFFEFGTMRFSTGSFEIKNDMAVNVGGNTGSTGGRENLIRLTGFKGDPVADWADAEDPDSQWTTLVSQNGEFWENISKIEATFFVTSDDSPAALTNVSHWFIPGGVYGFGWEDPGSNLLTQFDAVEDDDKGFVWGPSTAMTAVWDIDWLAAKKTRFRQLKQPPRSGRLRV